MRSVQLVEERKWDADVRDDQIAGVRVGRRKDSGIFGAASVTVIDASIAGPPTVALSAETPVGRSIATIGTPERIQVGDNGFEKPVQASVKAGAEDRVDDQVAIRQCGGVELPLLRVGDLDDRHADATEHFEVGAGVAAERPPTLPSRKTAVSTPRCTSVRATTNPSPPLFPRPQTTPTLARPEILERGLHRRNRLAAGVLHQHNRGNADVLDRLAIGFPHLFGVEHAHEPSRAYCLC